MLPKIKLHAHKLFKEKIFVILFLMTISLLSLAYFVEHNQILLVGDSLSRLNTSRKILDNLTPGFAQLGNVWLPLPQLLMLPLIWNDYLWHTGIAGSIVNMIAYVLGGYYLFKSARILSKSFIASVLALSVYALNINILYIQTTAMSEPLFLCTLSMAMYYFIAWITLKHKMQNLIFAALSISAATLIRYEALALLFSAIPMVFFYVWYHTKNYHHAESNAILFAALASLGFIFWTIYLTAIFGDPLYWKNYYADAHASDTGEKVFAQSKPFLSAIWIYLTSVVWMNGLIPTLLAIIALPLVIEKSIRKKSFHFLPVFLSLSVFAFMVLTLQRNTPIKQPDLTLANFMNPAIFDFSEFNIRYGLLMLPVITLLISYLFSFKSSILRVFIFALLLVQFSTYYYPGLVLIFQLPINIAGEEMQGSEKQLAMLKWMKKNYKNDGLIMISALKHDPQMFQLGVDYSTYIHEGTDRYWKEATANPQKYANWVVFDSDNDGDQVTKFLKDSPLLDMYYNRVYENKGMLVYKIKTKPDIIIKN